MWFYESTSHWSGRARDLHVAFTPDGLTLGSPDDDPIRQSLAAALHPHVNTPSGAARTWAICAAVTAREQAHNPAISLYAWLYTRPNRSQRVAALTTLAAGYTGSCEQLAVISANAASPAATGHPR